MNTSLSQLLLHPRSRFLLLFAVPALIASIYIFGIASNRFTSVSEAIVKDSLGFQKQDIDLPSLLLGANNATGDALQIKAYILSSSMALNVDEALGLKAHFQHSGNDFWSRLESDASTEDYLKYYHERIRVEFDELSGVLTISVETYEPEYAQVVAEFILQKAEEFINAIGNRIARSQLEFLRKESELAARELVARRGEIIAFQEKHDIFNPLVEGEFRAQIQGGVEKELVKSEAELRYLSGFMRSDAPDLAAARNKVWAIRKQLEAEKSKLISDKDGALNKILAEFQDLSTRFELATEVYTRTLAGVEQAQFEVARQMKHLIRLSEPTLPQDPTYPDHGYFVATMLSALALFYGIISMLVTIIQEHAE